MRRLAWLPIPILLLAIIVCRAVGLRGTYQADTLRLLLSFAFYTLVALATLFLLGRSFLSVTAPSSRCGVPDRGCRRQRTLGERARGVPG